MGSKEIKVTRPVPKQVQEAFIILGNELVSVGKLAKLKEEKEALEKEIETLDEKSSSLTKRKRLVSDEIDKIEEIQKTLKELEEKATEA